MAIDSGGVYVADEVREMWVEAERILRTISTQDLNYDVVLLTTESLRWSHERLTTGSAKDTQWIVAQSRETMENARAILAAVRANVANRGPVWEERVSHPDP